MFPASVSTPRPPCHTPRKKKNLSPSVLCLCLPSACYVSPHPSSSRTAPCLYATTPTAWLPPLVRALSRGRGRQAAAPEGGRASAAAQRKSSRLEGNPYGTARPVRIDVWVPPRTGPLLTHYCRVEHITYVKGYIGLTLYNSEPISVVLRSLH